MAEALSLNVGNIQLCLKGMFGKVSSSKNLYLIGSACIGNNLLNANELENLIRIALLQNNLVDFLSTLNGFYSAVYFGEEDTYLISDRFRSRPLFYAVGDGKLLVSDDYYCVVDSILEKNIDPVSEEEFLNTGYVTGYETLIKEISQIESAQYVKVGSDASKLKRVNYWLFLPKNDSRETKELMVSRLDKAFEAAIDRLLMFAEGRQLVVPLSGGYDSRAIILYLKEKGISNLITFTFGVATSPEVILSRKIAADLDVPWHFVPYTKKMWRELKSSSEFDAYKKFIGSGVSVANVQAFPAIKMLLDSAVINAKAVIIPGHSGFVAGGNLSERMVREIVSQEALLESLERDHYRLSRRKVSTAVRSKLKINTESLLPPRDLDFEFLQAAEAWECRERQSKFIVNSNRYYDFFGLDWWMPILDSEFVDNWAGVPYSERIRKRLWTDLVENKAAKIIGGKIRYGRSVASTNAFINFLKRAFNYYFDMNGLLALVPFWRWLLYRFNITKSKGTLFGYLSAAYVVEIREMVGRER